MLRRLAVGIFVASVLTVAAGTGRAQTTGSIEPSDRREELARLETEAAVSQETMSRLENEVKAIENDNLKLRADLVETGKRMHEVESALLSAESRMQALTANEATLKQSLLSRRGTLIEVIATLQRMGRRPPPALLVKPDDALAAIRTAMLLGTILPDMREQTRILASDLESLMQVRADIVAETNGMKQKIATLAEDRERLSLIMTRRNELKTARQAALEKERRRMAQLAKNVTSLKDLITKMDEEAAARARAEAEAQAAAQATAEAPPAEAPAPDSRSKLAMLADPNRLEPAQPFEKTKGTLLLPVSGAVLRSFGDADPLGAEQPGQSIVTRPSAIVSSPCDGWVVFAGPFRSYGKLLIVDAGGGYHILLAGMDRIDVDLGQFVLAGEPVGVMASGEAKVATTGDMAVTQPTLYVEFRKDNVSIDPAPWWSTLEEKARG